ncbi:serine carboxypeptidase-like 1 [Durio zibethinus]|uniref:Serine carboxypeptidase-like 1 n=1 Tax=Durio zibethinus TaxID=66656 RepID=A0A6P5YNB0_DURZI|nr:serine carboxypeptidase-like 1 [Durio zibethinus]
MVLSFQAQPLIPQKSIGTLMLYSGVHRSSTLMTATKKQNVVRFLTSRFKKLWQVLSSCSKSSSHVSRNSRAESSTDVSFSTISFLPGFSGSLPFKLETGYIGVGDVEFFYYFIESERNPAEDPVVLWLTGGPGCTALSGFFLEIGPLKFNVVEYNGSLPTFALNPYSWTKVANIIFLDAPVGTGFSYSRTFQGFKTGDKKFANDGYNFMRKVVAKPSQIHHKSMSILLVTHTLGKIVPINCSSNIRMANDQLTSCASGTEGKGPFPQLISKVV